MAGDFKANNSIWGSNINDRRGELLANLIASHNLVVTNTSNALTFEGVRRQ